MTVLLIVKYKIDQQYAVKANIRNKKTGIESPSTSLKYVSLGYTIDSSLLKLINNDMTTEISSNVFVFITFSFNYYTSLGYPSLFLLTYLPTTIAVRMTK